MEETTTISKDAEDIDQFNSETKIIDILIGKFPITRSSISHGKFTRIVYGVEWAKVEDLVVDLKILEQIYSDTNDALAIDFPSTGILEKPERKEVRKKFYDLTVAIRKNSLTLRPEVRRICGLYGKEESRPRR